MNKVFNINLGGYPFTIDEDAYEHLKVYLKTIHNHFRESEGYEEITSDIESRLAELFQDKLSDRPIVMRSTVKDAIAIMGTPEDFGAEPLTDDANYTEEKTTFSRKQERKTKSDYQTGKRLFRNPEEEVVGGVCSGIAAYFGVEDPLWVRLGFTFFFFAGGFALPLYLILWAIMPAAETAADRLAMRGKPVTASNIGKIIEEEMENFGEKMTEFGDGINEKFGDGQTFKKKSPDGTVGKNGSRNVLSEALSFLGSMLLSVIRVAKMIIKPILFIIGIVLIIAFAVAWVAAIISLFFGQSYLAYIFPDQMIVANLGVFSLFLMVGLPLISVIFLISRLLFATRVNPYLKRGVMILNILAWVGFFATGSYLSHEFHKGRSVEILTSSIQSDVLEIEFDGKYEGIADSEFKIIDEGNFELFENDNELITKNIHLNFQKGKGDNITVKQHVYTRGNSVAEVNQLAESLDYILVLEGNRLVLPTHFAIPKGVKYRGQRVLIDVSVPEGKSILLGENVLNNSHHFTGRSPSINENCSQLIMGKKDFSCPQGEENGGDNESETI
ncbi:MAG: phage shock protein PspC (stress-responsive transcriptional regulator) [Saprospiraceae bacterium]|jgi:phage shock protein PspC (stress-responsive transcriptional regulator)